MNYSIENSHQNKTIEAIQPFSELQYFTVTFILCLHGSHLIFLINKHMDRLRIVHLFELKSLLDSCFWHSCIIGDQLKQDFSKDPLFCYVVRIVQHASILCWAINTVGSQLEMFLSIYSNVYYITYVTSRRARLIFLSMNGSMVILSVVATLQKPGSLLCPADINMWSYITDTKHFYFVTIPELVTMGVMLAVGAYITYIHLNPPGHQVHVHLPPPILPQPPQVEQDLIIENMEDEVIIQPSQSQSTSTEPPIILPQLRQAPMETYACETQASLPTSTLPQNKVVPNIIVSDLTEEERGKTWQMAHTRDSCQNIPSISARVAPELHRIRRTDDNPFMFYRLPPSPPPPSPPGQCLPSGLTDALANVKKCLRINIVSLCVSGFLVPDIALCIYLMFCTDYDECHTSFEFYYNNIVGPLLFIFALLYPFLVKRKLDNFM